MDAFEPPVSSRTDTEAAAGDNDVVELATRLRLAIARLSRQLRQQAGTGLTPSQQSVLTSIEVNGSLTLGELAAIEQVAPPSITKIVAKLEEDGLVARSVDAVDRRIARVTVTAEGGRRLDHSRSRRNAWLATRLRTRTIDDIDRLSAAVEILEAMACGASPPSAQQPGGERDSTATRTQRPDGEPEATTMSMLP